jgi:putative MFS transporter
VGGAHSLFASTTKALLFWVGCAAVAAGVGLHIPMFLECADMGYRMAGMPMGSGMMIGMGLIVLGIVVTGYSLMPERGSESGADLVVEAGDEAQLSASHVMLMAVVAIALIIDTMKPATLGFVVPGMREEYGLSKATVALLPFIALIGTAAGSLVWGAIADLYGRRASILLAAIMFVGTSICGAMPSFAWNLTMCFLMGASAGGLLPVAYVLLSETAPARQRGWILVVVGGLGTAGGYLAASGFSWLLQPIFGWRIMWLLGLPTGLFLIALNRFIPESPKFLIHHGRFDEARAILTRFGAVVHEVVATPPAAAAHRRADGIGAIAALTVTGLTWGLINFGLLLWLPAELHAHGYSIDLANTVLAKSALLALPTVLAAAIAYSLWSTKWSLVATLAVAAAGLVGVVALQGSFADTNPVPILALVVIGANAILAVLLPYAAENSTLAWRGRATGWVAAATKIGGIGAQATSVLGIAPDAGTAAALLIVPLALSVLLLARYGAETRGRILADAQPATAS